MDWLERMNNVLDYIEENLEQEVSYKKMAQVGCCSEYHLSRMFSAIAGISLSEYIRRRRLTLAGFEIQKSDIRIMDAAIKYGYDSVDSFSRAFKKTHGLPPSAARAKGISLKAFPKISFQISIKGDTEMEYRIEQLDFEIKIVGKSKFVKTSKAFKMIPTLWNTAKKDGFMQELIDMSWENPKCTLESLLGVCGKEAAITDDEFAYFMGVRYDDDAPSDMETLIIPPATWAVFPNIVEAWKRLYSEWIPTSGYELANLPCMECYYPPKHKPRHELWVPINAK
ncbi:MULTISPECIES: AraC family transcriptional regulator [Clostridia]|uniref:AraC family transcriptional regulator n=1 Tax=Clostridia TaxID=186801 RepID=UPI000EA0C18E|nr:MULTISPECIES: AraC family transcriptional regulator [Clostridia]NBJ69521.1 AraC family transcriptional regulator [Roseburia sp. 1XD42-34]RKI78593.1 AraC family transcriptional regulator [Clostridium sp. 1xD42-85]